MGESFSAWAALTECPDWLAHKQQTFVYQGCEGWTAKIRVPSRLGVGGGTDGHLLLVSSLGRNLQMPYCKGKNPVRGAPPS